ncbi:MAG TPA: sialidase family protein, partial [Candidatus Limnocylindria bacterium]
PSSTPEPQNVAFAEASVPGAALNSGMTVVLPGGDGLVALGFDGAFGTILWTSTDGTEWRDVTPEGFARIGVAGATVVEDGLVGVGRGDTINVDANVAAAILSEDGLAWRPAPGGLDLQGQMIDVIETDDGLFAVGGVPGADSAGVWRSTDDGETWERIGGDLEHAFLWSIAEGGPGLVAVGWRRNPEPDAAVWTSADAGTTWELGPDPEGFAGFEATDILSHDGSLVMAGSAFDGRGGQIWTSADGMAWELADVSGGMDGTYARSLVATPMGLVAVGGGDDAAARAWISSDGRSWEPLGEPLPDAYFNAAFATDDGLVVAGATQTGTLETGIESHAQLWTAALGR